MTNIQFSEVTRSNLQRLLYQKVVAIDMPHSRIASNRPLLKNFLAIRLTLGDDTAVFFSVDSIYLNEEVEVFVIEATSSLELGRHPGGTPTTWQPIIALPNQINGSSIEDIRSLSANWQIVAGSQGQSLYGSDPHFLDHSSSNDATSYDIEDGLILFFSNGCTLVISTIDTLPGTLALRPSVQ